MADQSGLLMQLNTLITKQMFVAFKLNVFRELKCCFKAVHHCSQMTVDVCVHVVGPLMDWVAFGWVTSCWKRHVLVEI